MAVRILVIEDNDANLALMDYLLQAFGYVTLLAQGGITGLSIAKHELPDLILCDIQMPVLDGFAVAKILKKDDILCNIPLIAVTALAMFDDQNKILTAGFNGYITKPIIPETFIDELEGWLINHKSIAGKTL